MGYETKDSGKKDEFESGMLRDCNEGKIRYDLVNIPMLKRWAGVLTRGATKYGARNRERAHTEKDLERFEEAAFRHFIQWFSGEDDEDHAAAVFFNISGAEHVKEKNKSKDAVDSYDPNIENKNKIQDYPYMCGGEIYLNNNK